MLRKIGKNRNLTPWVFAENCMEMKEIGPKPQGASLAPLDSAMRYTQIFALVPGYIYSPSIEEVY